MAARTFPPCSVFAIKWAGAAAAWSAYPFKGRIRRPMASIPWAWREEGGREREQREVL